MLLGVGGFFRCVPAKVLHQRCNIEPHQKEEQHATNNGQGRQGLQRLLGRHDPKSAGFLISVFPTIGSQAVLLSL